MKNLRNSLILREIERLSLLGVVAKWLRNGSDLNQFEKINFLNLVLKGIFFNTSALLCFALLCYFSDKTMEGQDIV